LKNHPTQIEPEKSDRVSKVDEGAFMNLISAIQSIHLTVWVTVKNSGTLRRESIALTDERSQVHAAGRIFSKGSVQEAGKQIRQALNGFNRKKAEWENRVRQSENDSTRRRAMRELQQKRSNHNPISVRIAPAENQFRRLIEAIDLHVVFDRKREATLRQEASNSSSAVPAELEQVKLPAGFLEPFSNVKFGEREAIIRQVFDVEAEILVELTDDDPKQKIASFRPPLPKNRLYYLVDAVQVVRLRRVKITNIIHYHNFVTQQNETMPLQSFIESVQAGGVWLLQPKTVPSKINSP
jgi:hypothetical protein